MKLCEELLNKGLAVKREGEHPDDQQLEFHPKLYLIYMEALAEQMALNRLFHPVTDNLRDHVAVGGYTLERLAQALLKSTDGLPYLAGLTRRPDEAESLLSTIALEAAFSS